MNEYIHFLSSSSKQVVFWWGLVDVLPRNVVCVSISYFVAASRILL